TAARQMQFEFSLDCRFFLEIAKLRAARRLWYRVVEASGGTPDSARMRIHARTGRRVQTARDPWVNMLRNTATCFAASAAGVQSITTDPFDAQIGRPDAFSRRIARNTQIVLNEESHLARVLDPAGGSHFIEKTTDVLAEKAWALFQDIERAGGMAACLKSGDIAERIEVVHSKRATEIAVRKQPITGVTEFPNVREKSVEKTPVNLNSLRRDAAVRLEHEKERSRRGSSSAAAGQAESGASLAQAIENLQQGARSAFTEPADRDARREPGPGRPGMLLNAATQAMIAGASVGEVFQAAFGEFTKPESIPAPIAPRPFAEPFEAMRDASDRAERSGAGRPKVFLANMGPLAQHNARATFAQNFFEIGGFDVLTNNGFESADAAAEAFRESGAKIAVICSSDPLYEEFVPTVAPKLKAAGARTVVLAGGFGDHEQAWRDAGVDKNIFLKCNVLEILGDLLADEGVEVE
ncbi:MAG: methylmalonyl-CoA mutase family protein, partial [Planctomycetota bacterium]